MGTEKLPITVAASLCRSNPNPLDQAQKKNGEDFVLAVVGNIAWPGLLALAAGVLGFYGQGLFADTLAEIGQLGPAHTALPVDNHFFNAR